MFLIFSVRGGEVWYLERDGDPEDEVHGADWLGTKCTGDNTWIVFEDMKKIDKLTKVIRSRNDVLKVIVY